MSEQGRARGVSPGFAGERGRWMRCLFCNKEVGRERKRWHLDCIDSAIEEEYGIELINLFYEESEIRKKVPITIKKLIDNGVREGGRHRTRFLIFRTLKERKYPDIEIKAVLRKFNSVCTPPEVGAVVEYHFNNMVKQFEREKRFGKV